MSEEQNRLAKAVLDLRAENDRLRAELRKKKELRNVDRPECRTFEMDEVDFNFVCRVLSKAKATFEDRMMDTSLSEPFRNHFRESAKMANTALDIMFDEKHDGEKKGGAE